MLATFLFSRGGIAAGGLQQLCAGSRRLVTLAGPQCLYAASVTAIERPDNTVIVNTTSRDYYEFRTQPYCADRIDWEKPDRTEVASAAAYLQLAMTQEIYVPEAMGRTLLPAVSTCAN